MLIISRSPENDKNAFEDELATLAAKVTRVLVIPHIYYLSADHPAHERIKESEGQIIVASWLYARAAKSAMDALGINAKTFDLKDFNSPEEFMQKFSETSELSGEGSADEITDSVSQRWYPIIDYERCVDCGMCREFCLFGVYGQDEGRVVVNNPDGCKPGCPACAKVCPQGAIIFPHCQTDEGVAGKDGAEIKSTDVSGAREFARGNIQAYNTEKKDDAQSDELDKLIDDLDKLDV